MVKKGLVEERDLVNKLWDMNFAAMRSPASGRATKKPLPDVIAGNGKIYLAIEVKTTIKDKIYIKHSQIDALIEFANTFGAKPYLGIKFKYNKWFFLSPDLIEKTKNGNYNVEKNYCLEKAYELNEICEFNKQIKF